MNAQDAARHDRPISITIALAVHGAILVGGTFWISPVEYGVEAGSGGMEVHLVAALPAASAGNPAVATTVESTEIMSTEPAETLPAPSPAAQPTPQESRKPPASPASNTSAHIGDGSSAIPGKDATTFHSSAGARTGSGPSYFRNPAPAYPALARKSGYEGVVLLRAEVTPGGRCGQLAVVESSGYSILDEAAREAIRRWRFKPARRAGSAISSWVEIPVRFAIVD